MYHKARRVALNTISRTPFEPIARKVYGVLVPSKGNKYDKQTFALMKHFLKSDSNCIDVGAYRGEILGPMTKLAPNGKHFAFEPVPENYKFLARKYPTAKVFNMAVSSKKGQTIFQQVVGREARSGLVRVDYPDANQEIREIKVKLDSLDNVIPKNIRVDFLKIDVEGAELGVLQGAKDLIAKHKPLIVFEHELTKAALYNTKPQDIYDLLVKQSGLKIYTMSEYFDAKKPLSRTAFTNAVNNNTDFYFMALAV